MRIGIDCRPMYANKNGERAGIGHYTAYLVKHLVAQYPDDTFVLFFDELPQDHFSQELFSHDNVSVVQFPIQQYKKFLPIVHSHGVVARSIQKQKLDVFHGPANTTPLGYFGKSVVTVHDLAIYKHPEWFPDESPFAQKVLVPESLKKAARIIAVSESTEKEMGQLFAFTKQKTDVVYEGVIQEPLYSEEQKQAVLQKHNIQQPFIFFIGTIEPRKNLARLVKAYDSLMEQVQGKYEPVQLIIAGGSGWKNDEVFRAASWSHWQKHIKLLGYISHEDKIALLQSTVAFVFPSLWEGFGLPVLEAMQSGAPVVTSRGSALTEVGGEAVSYIDPQSIDSITHGLMDVITNEQKRAELWEAGRKRAGVFSWERCANETYAVYTKVAQK